MQVNPVPRGLLTRRQGGSVRSRTAAVARHRPGPPPRAPRLAADRGYGQPACERDLHQLGVATVAIPRQGKISAIRRQAEHHRRFRRLVRCRTGCEGRISYLKRGYGWDRTRLDTRQGAAGTGSFVRNLLKIGSLDR